MNDVLWNMEGSDVTAFIANDLLAAFDMVDHGILLDVFQYCFGVTGMVRKWFKSYLSPRQFQVNIGKAYSEPIDLEFSVPQVVVPGLFLLYASTIAEVIPPTIDIHGYADDHEIKGKFKAKWNVNEIELETIQRLESCLDDIKAWMDVNRLKMNSSKTEFILFASRWQLQKCMTNSINVNGVEGLNMVVVLDIWEPFLMGN